MREHLHAEPVLINAAKGLELGTLSPCSRIVAEELAGRPFHYAMLSGPSFAAEVVRDQPHGRGAGHGGRSPGLPSA